MGLGSGVTDDDDDAELSRRSYYCGAATLFDCASDLVDLFFEINNHKSSRSKALGLLGKIRSLADELANAVLAGEPYPRKTPKFNFIGDQLVASSRSTRTRSSNASTVQRGDAKRNGRRRRVAET